MTLIYNKVCEEKHKIENVTKVISNGTILLFYSDNDYLGSVNIAKDCDFIKITEEESL